MLLSCTVRGEQTPNPSSSSPLTMRSYHRDTSTLQVLSCTQRDGGASGEVTSFPGVTRQSGPSARHPQSLSARNTPSP